MHIRVTSVAAEEIGSKLGKVSVDLEDALNPFFMPKNFGGIETFMAVIVAVDSDASENNRFAKGHNKVGSYKNPVTSERVKFISCGLPFDPLVIDSISDEQRRQLVCKALLDRLDNPAVKVPTSFDYEAFVTEMRLALKIYSGAER